MRTTRDERGQQYALCLIFKGDDPHHYLLFKAVIWFIFTVVLIGRYEIKRSEHHPFYISLGVDFERD